MKTIVHQQSARVLLTLLFFIVPIGFQPLRAQGASCDPPPSGLVGWWKGEGNTLDSAGTNNGGVIVNAGYTNGVVGQAFEIDPENWQVGTFNGILIPDSPAYILTNTFTIECWIRPRGNGYTIFTRADNQSGHAPYYFDMQDDNVLQFGITDNSNNHCLITTPLVYNVWWHIAGTYSNGLMVLYTNGMVAAQTNTPLVPVGALDSNSHPGIGIGNINDGRNNFPFTGDIDEFSLYNRALSQLDIQAIYDAGSAGKCSMPTAPAITAQPTNETVTAGQTATFNVTASGTQPLYYQWIFDNTNIIGATNATLMLSDVQSTNAGIYAVVVSNFVQSVTSSNAVLTVDAASCDPPPAGMVGWWKGEGNAYDSAGTNNGVIVNAGYTNGVVGQAFEIDPENWPVGTFNGVLIPDSPAYILTNTFTIECWIRPRGDSYEIFTRGDNRPGLDPYSFSMEDDNIFKFAITDNSGNSCTLTLPLVYNVWWHMAGTYSNGVMILYTNGAVAAQITTAVVPIGALIPGDHPGVGIGNNNDGFNNFPFTGDIDEVSLYNRALSAGEIAAIYNAGTNGKCINPTPPTITAQPTNETVTVGQTASFSVTASGTQPLYYQWQFDSTNILNATNATLVLAGAQLTNAGTYTVIVSNFVQSVTSSNAVLTVNPPSSCDPPPSGLVAWWKGDGNTYDSVANNNGIIINAGYTNGIVGQAFEIDPENWTYGTFNGVLIPDSPAYALTNAFTIECWIRPRGDGYTIFIRGDNPCNAYYLSMGDNNILQFGIHDSSLNGCQVTAPVVYNVWWHVAGTFNNGVLTLYTNGVMAAQTTTTVVPAGVLNPNQHPGVGIGNLNDGFNNFPFTGDIDEVSLYNRVLSPSEIHAIYNAGTNGKCINPTPPTITTQPTNETVTVGQTASFSVTASGSQPLYYQWQFDSTNILNATNATLVLPNAQLTNAGTYAVVVSNLVESVLSSNAVLTVNVPSCDPPPSGLVGWWKGDGNAWDSSGYPNNGTVVNAGYTNGVVGEAFSFDPENWPSGTYTGVEIPDSPAYVLTNAFTIEGWIRPRGNGGFIFIRGDNRGGYDPYVLRMQGNTTLALQITDGANNTAQVSTTISYNTWWHVAATFSNGVMDLFTNGVLAAQTVTALVPLGNLIPGDHPGVGIGNINDGAYNLPFIGDIDEMSLYKRALSQAEIQAIYNAGSSGKCFTPVPPTITTQPTNETVNVGQAATFSVAASGTQPLYYQWTFNSNNILNATNATFIIPDVQFTNAGTYAVVVSNSVESVTSSNAVLTVNPSPPCDSPPAGLVGWWKGDGNTYDSASTNNGLAQGNLAYGSGEVGQSFEMDGSSAYVKVPANPHLNVGTAAGFTIEGWVDPSDVSVERPIFEWDNGSVYGSHFWISVRGVGNLYGNLVDTGGSFHQIVSANGLVQSNVFQHVALTYDKTSGLATLYLNGGVVTQQNLGNFTPQTSYNVFLGYRPIPDIENYWLGGLDEVSLYNRALSAGEIAAIYNAGSSGKCFTPTPPAIITQPTNEFAYVGQSVSFTVSTTGSQLLNYQWQFNDTNIPGATNAALTLSEIQLTNAGVYDVTVSNYLGGTVSSNAVLTVSPLDHFSWAAIPTPRFVNVPFPVTILAQDLSNNTVLGYTNPVFLGALNSVPINPAVSGNFTQGTWSGSVIITQPASNVVLQANDAAGHIGQSGPFNVLSPPSVQLQISGNFLLLNWPNDYPSFVVEESSNLFPGSWTDVPVTPLQIGNQNIVPLDMVGTNGFYRLRFTGQ